MTSVAERFRTDGFCSLAGLLSRERVAPLATEADEWLARSPERGGARNLLGMSEVFRDLAREMIETGPIAHLLRDLLGSGARAVKLTLFDKTADANWPVPWHQDLTIAVRERREVPGFGPWTVKGGVPHVQPPVEVLEKIVAVRLHLDAVPADNGALRVLPGSHRHGRLDDEAVRGWRKRASEAICEAEAGDALLLSPLLLHASSPAAEPTRRRVLHYEMAGEALPGGLKWAGPC